MKELLTKKFWQDVKNTFDEARADTNPTGEDSTVISAAEVKSEVCPAEETLVQTDARPSERTARASVAQQISG